MSLDTSAWNSLTELYTVLNKKFSICWSMSSVSVTQLWSLQHLQSQENILLQSCLAYAWSHIVTSLPVCQFTEKHSYFLQNSSYSKMHFGSVGDNEISSDMVFYFSEVLFGKALHNTKTGMTLTGSPVLHSCSLCFFLSFADQGDL